MRISSLIFDAPPAIRLSLIFTSLIRCSSAVTFNPVPSPNLDLSQLGRVGLAGDFGGISLYQFEGQNQNGFSTNGSQSVLSRFPNGGFANLAASDAGIHAMCSFVMQDGVMAGVVVGGNFTSLGGRESPGAALFNSNTAEVTPLSGLSGSVSALLCDQETSTVYVGGSFKGANSTNAIAWVGTSGWTNLPFAGFNGPVTSITKASNGNIIFGGSFTGLGNTPTTNTTSSTESQPINLQGANITSASTTSNAGFTDPKNIICKTGGASGAGNTWLLRDNSAGSWRADFGFGFEPTRLRLYNTHLDGRGTKTWRFTAFPINGIMNFTYTNPTTGVQSSCSSECPLSDDASVKFQDFFFVNKVGMNSFQVDVSAFYGAGGGLNGIEIFEDNIFAYAVERFNTKPCEANTAGAAVTTTGPWRNTPSGQSVGEYLTASVTGSELPSVTFFPEIKQSGNYSVNIYTPGCLQDQSCDTRGRVNITGNMASNGQQRFENEIFQTNNFDKFDQIYFGYVDASANGFRPSIVLRPSAGQEIPNHSIVALRVGFTLTSATAGIQSIFEYDPSYATVTSAQIVNSTFTKAGTDLGTGSEVNALVTSGGTTFVGGNFTSTAFDNIFAVTGSNTNSLSQGGLNGEVSSLFLNGTNLYVGGRFNGTKNGGTNGLNGVASYDVSGKSWGALGAGVSGKVKRVVPLLLNITANVPETVITLTGDFDQILAFGNNTVHPVGGFAVWVPSQNNWLQNLQTATVFIDGTLTAFVNVPNNGTLFAGSLSSSALRANGAVTLSKNLNSLPINIRPTESQPSNTLSKRAVRGQNITGVVTGTFYERDGRNFTILGGRFTAAGSDGSDVHNLAFINGASSNAVTGVGKSLSQDSTILSLAVQQDTLWAGGALTGTVNGASVNGIIAWNLASSSFITQPPSLGGGDVHTISIRPEGSDVYVGGNFATAGSLGCPGLCTFNTQASQWDRPGSNLDGAANTMLWETTNKLIVGGQLSVSGSNVSLAAFDVNSQNWTAYPGADQLPGPITALSAASSDRKQLWAAGVATNGSAFLVKYDGKAWNSVGDRLGQGSDIRGLQILSLTEDHAQSNLLDRSKTLMITGALNIPGFGNASAVLFNGTSFQPYALTSNAANTGGSISQIFSQKQNFFESEGSFTYSSGSIFIMLTRGNRWSSSNRLHSPHRARHSLGSHTLTCCSRYLGRTIPSQTRRLHASANVDV